MSAILNAAILSLPLTAAVWLALRALPRRALGASARCLIWWIALLAVIALPILYLPVSSTPLPVTAVIVRAAATHPFAPPSAPPPAPITIPPAPHTDWLAAAWILSAAVMLLRLLLSCAALLRLKRAARSAGLAIPLPRRARILASPQVAAPITAGFLRPAVLLPEALLTQLAPDQLEQVVLHESAHLARRDDYAILAERTIEAVFALHPCVRFIARQLDLEREIACDDRVIAATNQGVSYAACLTRVAELCGRVPLPAAAFFPNASQLSRRIDMLLDRRPRARFLKTRVAIALVAALAAAAMLAKAPRLLAFSVPIPVLQAAPALLSVPAIPPPSIPLPYIQKAKPAPRLLAQAQRPPQPSPPPAAAQPLDIVMIPVQVTDRDGDFVAGLVSRDFLISQDSAPQPVAYFALDGDTYLLGYIKPPDPGEGKYAHIRITVDRPNLRVYARSGYYASAGSTTCQQRVRDALGLPGNARCL